MVESCVQNDKFPLEKLNINYYTVPYLKDSHHQEFYNLDN